ncbi:MAG: beta galactosidase jelly roll domain-containing protein, partial [Acidobacteriota bacterium]|nr:beta galactosidase jelly roll domain-containing protein [Acidobacteriota bacterium]
MKKILFLISFLVCSAGSQAQQTGLIANVAGRNTVSLDGQWKAIIDPYETGETYHFAKDARPKSKSELQEYSFDTAASLNVPGDWNTQRPELFFYEGVVWYRRTFDYQRKPNTRLFVHFGAANYTADVYLNGERLGRHEGGFTPFNFEVTNLVREKENSLVVKVDDRRRPEGVPTLNTDWWNYGGLTRQVTLVEVPETFIEDYFIQLSPRARDQVSGWVKLSGAKLNQKITIRIPEAGINKTFTTDASGRAEINFNAKLALWSPESPKLYRVEIAAESDHVEDLIGFRSIEVRGTDILLNGKPIFLRGVCIHEEAPLRGGRAYGREDARTLLGWAKELGANFVRLAHYPHNEFMTREADRVGLLVWSEIPVYWDIKFD